MVVNGGQFGPERAGSAKGSRDYVGGGSKVLDKGKWPPEDAEARRLAVPSLEAMPFVFVVSREPRTRTTVTEYLRERGYDTATAGTYEEAMDALDGVVPDGLVVDVQGLPRGENGPAFTHFNHWLQDSYSVDPPTLVYLLHKGARRPNFLVEGVVIKKPFPYESLGQALREQLGHPRNQGSGPGLDLDLASNTLRGVKGEVHLTNIEANLLAYLIEHEGEILHPRDLLMEVWQYSDSAGASTLVRAHVSNLRSKLKAVLGSAEQIQTIRGKGYRYTA